ncbi:aspartate aminotransferase family protein [Acidothermaceae bacterium B102]|nr:aspartate aminotransferase family protein [Acidothermaceae bacterium B102]
MTTTPQTPPPSGERSPAPDFDEARNNHLQEAARRHLWMHFTRMSSYDTHEIPIITRGEGAYVWDSRGRRYLDGLSGLFVVQAGHGRGELADAASKQANELAYFPLWSYGHPSAIELAERLASYAPGDLNRVFFTTGGGEAVESAWKLARQYFKAIGEPGRYKVISRDIAYHGATMGALSITGLAAIKNVFEPLVPGSVRVPNTNFYRAPEHGDDINAFSTWAADEIERAILREGPESVCAVFVEPVQNSGGCFPPPPEYFQKVREICDRHGVLMVSDEVICAFGRLGEWFGATRFGYQPDIITMAKGMSSGYSPIGAMIASDKLMEPFLKGDQTFLHGLTFAGHPVSAAVALANLDIFERENLLGHVRDNRDGFRATLEKLTDLPIVGEVRGDGYFYGIEMVKDKVTKETFDDDESERLLRGFLSGALFEAGLVCRADDRGDPVIQLAPPLICGQEQFDEIEQILRSVLTEAWARL